MKEKSLAACAPKVEQPQVNNRKVSVWTKEKINHLIQLYKKHECLWNHWHEAYKSKDKRNRAIADICSKLQIPKFEFGKKIHNLRNQFNTEMKKLEQRIEEAGVNIEDSKDTELRCKWSHFESLMFLRHVIEPRPGSYQTALQPLKKMRLKYNLSSPEEGRKGTQVGSEIIRYSSYNNVSNAEYDATATVNAEDLPQYQCDDSVNEEVIIDDFHTFENELVELDESNCNEDICDRKYQQSQPQDSSSISSGPFLKSSTHKKVLNVSQTSSASSQGNCLQTNNDSSTTTTNVTVMPAHSRNTPVASSSSTPITTPVVPIVAPSNSSNISPAIIRDQWDAFGELVANEFRNLNSEVSRKRLKRKIMHAMLEVGEEDDDVLIKHSSV